MATQTRRTTRRSARFFRATVKAHLVTTWCGLVLLSAVAAHAGVWGMYLPIQGLILNGVLINGMPYNGAPQWGTHPGDAHERDPCKWGTSQWTPYEWDVFQRAPHPGRHQP